MRIGNVNTAESQAEGKAWAIGFANHNLPDKGEVLKPDDISYGCWNTASKTFTAGGPTNAVRVYVRRAAQNNNGIATFFMNVFGDSEFDITTTAVAMVASASSADVVPLAVRPRIWIDRPPRSQPPSRARTAPRRRVTVDRSR